MKLYTAITKKQLYTQQ